MPDLNWQVWIRSPFVYPINGTGQNNKIPVLLHLLHLCGTSQPFQLCLLVGGVGLEPTCPLGSGFTGRRANQIAQSAQNFCRFTRFPTSQWATTFALQGYLLLRFKCLPNCHTKSYQLDSRTCRIRTCDPLLPRQVLYQAELMSVSK